MDSFSREEFISADNKCLENIVNIANICIDLGYWPMYFKMSLSIIISKPKKTFYDSPKSFHPIILLNMLRKFIKKVIGKCLQFDAIANNFVYPY